jgi:protein-disulfide isomerase
VYKHLPFTSLHPQAGLAAQAAECAGEQSYYWEMHHQLFTNPAEWNTSQEAELNNFVRYAEVLGINGDQVHQCIVDNHYADKVEQNFQEGIQLGLNGTPAFIINGKLLAGAHPADTFVSILRQELGE